MEDQQTPTPIKCFSFQEAKLHTSPYLGGTQQLRCDPISICRQRREARPVHKPIARGHPSRYSEILAKVHVGLTFDREAIPSKNLPPTRLRMLCSEM